MGVVMVAVDGAVVAVIVFPGDVAHGVPVVGDAIVVDHLSDAVLIA